MKRAFLLFFVLLAVYSSVRGSIEPLPPEFHGYWVPSSGDCSSSLGIRVLPYTIQFREGEKLLSFPIEPCFSCEGGSRYDGIVVWAIPVKSESQLFTAYFNAGERKRVAIVEVSSPELQSQFPINNVELKPCVGDPLIGGAER